MTHIEIKTIQGGEVVEPASSIGISNDGYNCCAYSVAKPDQPFAISLEEYNRVKALLMPKDTTKRGPDGRPLPLPPSGEGWASIPTIPRPGPLAPSPAPTTIHHGESDALTRDE